MARFSSPPTKFARLPILCILGCALLSGCSPAIKQRANWANNLASGIQLQSTPDQVLAYLNDGKIEHSQYQRDTAKGSAISAFLRHDSTSWALIKADYKIVFHFDNNNRLASSEIYEKYTGP
jgi:hypothetical protein